MPSQSLHTCYMNDTTPPFLVLVAFRKHFETDFCNDFYQSNCLCKNAEKLFSLLYKSCPLWPLSLSLSDYCDPLLQRDCTSVVCVPGPEAVYVLLTLRRAHTWRANPPQTTGAIHPPKNPHLCSARIPFLYRNLMEIKVKHKHNAHAFLWKSQI